MKTSIKLILGVAACLAAVVALTAASFSGLPSQGSVATLVDMTGTGTWKGSNAIIAQTSATAFHGITNVTRFDVPANCSLLTIEVKGLQVGGGTTNLHLNFAKSLSALANGTVLPGSGAATNIDRFWSWPIALAADTQVFVCTNLTYTYPCIYLTEAWMGYTDGYLTNLQVKISAK